MDPSLKPEVAKNTQVSSHFKIPQWLNIQAHVEDAQLIHSLCKQTAYRPTLRHTNIQSSPPQEQNKHWYIRAHPRTNNLQPIPNLLELLVIFYDLHFIQVQMSNNCWEHQLILSIYKSNHTFFNYFQPIT